MSEDLTQVLLKVDDELKTIERDLTELKQRKRKLLEQRSVVERSIKQRSQVLVSADSSGNMWETGQFKWSSQLLEKLSVFGFSAFREMQKSAINASMSGEDVIIIMSTGAGKSLCYQMPSLMSNGFTLVICPLLSLMEDQLMYLQKVGVNAAMLTATSTKEEVNSIQASMISSSSPLKLLYVTPEKIAKSKRFVAKVEAAYKAGRLARIAIDEVHCCSQWGHDFRPDYKFLNILKRQYPNTPILGLTATATDRVIDDIKDMLALSGALVFRSGFNRKNLFYEVRDKPQSQADFVKILVKLIKGDFANQSGIIYCFSRKESEELTNQLCINGIKAQCYHAELSADVRRDVHQRWAAEKCHVIVATVAFGMGIDKPNVRFVIHQSLPKSMENYFQESGRAGRDGLNARCVLFYRFGDIFRQSTMVCTEHTCIENFYAMVAYCHNTDLCRRQLIARQFGVKWEPDWCSSMCDNCRTVRNQTAGSVPEFDSDVMKEAAQKIVAVLKEYLVKDQKLTALKLLDLLQKDRSGEVKTKSYFERAIVHLLLEGYLKEDFHFTPYNIISYLAPGVKARMLDDKNHKII